MTLQRVRAREGLQYPALQLPTFRHGFTAPRVVVNGTGRWLDALGAALHSTKVHLRRTVSAVGQVGERVVLSHDGDSEELDAVVLAVPPWIAGPLLSDERRSLLMGVESIAAEVSLTEGPPPTSDERALESAFFVVTGGKGPPSLVARVDNGFDRDLWRSWTVPGDRQNGRVLASRSYRHLIPTPEGLEALESALKLQGRGGIYLGGGTSFGWDSQEGALQSAVAVAFELAPRSSRLSTLLGAMAARRGTRASVAPLP
jgi:predicted NAD/FAD-binding protein